MRLALLIELHFICILSYLPNPTPSHHLSSISLPKCIRNEGCFIFCTRDWEKNNKKHFHNVEIGNDILIYINIKNPNAIKKNPQL